MSEESPSDSSPKKSLSDFLPDKTPVETSVGVLYVRHANVSDLSEFQPGEPASVGAMAIRRLSSRSPLKGDKEQLSAEDFAALDANDIQSLAPVIAKASDWKLEHDPATLEGLGQAAIEGAEDHRRQQKEFFERMRTSIGSNYDFLSSSTLERLQDQVGDLAKLRSSLPRNELGEALRRSRTATDAVREALEHPGGRLGDTFRTPSPIDLPRIHIPMPEETPVGRATVESAEHVRLMADKMEALTELIAGLNQTVVTEVLPAWFKQVKKQQEQAEHEQAQATQALVQAKDSLWWTKWAVIASVVVTVGTAAWQVRVATSMDSENGAVQREAQAKLLEQLRALQDLLQLQLQLQRDQLRQQTQDAEALRRELSQVRERPAVAAPKPSSRGG